MGIENVKNIKKNKRNLLLFGGEIQNLGGEISPPLKALKKHCFLLEEDGLFQSSRRIFLKTQKALSVQFYFPENKGNVSGLFRALFHAFESCICGNSFRNVASSLNTCSIQAVERKHKVNTSMQTSQLNKPKSHLALELSIRAALTPIHRQAYVQALIVLNSVLH